MSKITFQNKTYLDENPDIADVNKFKDTDINSIKNAVNQNGSYIELTESSTAGNFYCTLEGSLSTGDVVRVTFPQVTTTTTENLQLSIDGGTTYYPITDLDNNNLQIGNIDKNMELVYGGNYGYNTFVLNVHNSSSNSVNGVYSCDYVNNLVQVMCACTSADITAPTTITPPVFYSIPINTIITNSGDKLSLSNGAIKIGAGVSKIRMSASVNVGTGSNRGGTGLNFRIKVNNGAYVECVTSGVANSVNQLISSSPMIAEVSENDLITFGADLYKGDRIMHNANRTYIVVEVVE